MAATAIGLLVLGCGSSTSERATVDVLSELSVGMSTAEVSDVLGNPDQRLSDPEALPPGATSSELWGYETTDAMVAVVFEDDRVASYRGTDRIVTVGGT